MGNIATYSAPGKGTVTYTYDNQGQLLKAEGDATYLYVYDSVGNILAANGHTYTYGDANWKDLLTAFDGNSITYDASGNPTSYYNGTRWTMTWANGRSLATASDGTTSLSFTYDTNGLRTSKKVGTVTHKYLYASGKLMRETYGGNTLDFFYDANGTPYALKYNGTVYYYVTNLQGDVMRIVNASGNTVASYEYDPYGKVISATGTLAGINPIRYRGYYYDTETGFYYLQSRYYDPVVGRFISADGYASTGQGLLDKNMFAYCKNNPITMADDSGPFAITAALATKLAVVAVSAVISGVSNAISTAATGGSIRDCLIAGAAGAIGGTVGALIATLPYSSPQLYTAARGAATFATDFLTIWMTTGCLPKEDDWAWMAVDVTMDMTLSTITYFYNPIPDSYLVKQTVVNAAIDGALDIAESKLFLDGPNSQNRVAAASTTNRTARERKDTWYYVHRKVGILLGIIT